MPDSPTFKLKPNVHRHMQATLEALENEGARLSQIPDLVEPYGAFFANQGTITPLDNNLSTIVELADTVGVLRALLNGDFTMEAENCLYPKNAAVLLGRLEVASRKRGIMLIGWSKDAASNVSLDRLYSQHGIYLRELRVSLAGPAMS